MTMGPAPMIMIEAMSVRFGMRLSLARRWGPALVAQGEARHVVGRERYTYPDRKGKKPDLLSGRGGRVGGGTWIASRVTGHLHNYRFSFTNRDAYWP